MNTDSRLSRLGRCLFLVIASCGVAAPHLLWAEPAYKASLTKAKEARDRKNGAECLEAAVTALSLCPDHPPSLFILAQAYALQEKPDRALLTLTSLQERGLVYDIRGDKFLGTVFPQKTLLKLQEEFDANGRPTGPRQPEITLPAQTGIIESLAYYAAKDEWFFSDVQGRRIIKRSPAGEWSELSVPSDKLLGVFGLTIDEAQGRLWASCAALPLIKNFVPAERGRAELVCYDLKTGQLVSRAPVPPDGEDHLLGDLALSPTGEIFLTDTATPMIWRYRSGQDQLEKLCTYSEFSSLQGIVWRGANSLLVADYALGLFTVNVDTKTVEPLRKLPIATFAGIDGMALTPQGLLIVQNGINPQRVAFVSFRENGQPATMEVLAQSPTAMIEPTHIKVVGDSCYLVANSGWDKFPTVETTSTTPHDVHIFRVALP